MTINSTRTCAGSNHLHPTMFILQLETCGYNSKACPIKEAQEVHKEAQEVHKDTIKPVRKQKKTQTVPLPR